ncbi:MAG: excisionase family DNA-binding protein [Gaiellales bacterium]
MDCLLLTRTEVAERLKISVRTVDRLLARGELRAIRVGSRRRVTIAELDRYVRAAMGLLGEGSDRR